MMRFASLGSGSEGNGLLVESAGTRILADCGFGLADTVSRLARLGVAAESVDAILVTHEHDDHVGGVARFARKFKKPVWLTYGTLQASIASLTGVENVRVFDCAQKFSIDAIEVEPYTVPHDAREPVQFVFSDGQRRLGVLTDTGAPTAHISACLSGVDALVLECNHDLNLLEQGGYPEWLKRRVGGPLGHLSNRQAAQLLASIDHSRLQHLVAAHLSASNNSPALAQSALAGVIGCEPGWIGVADQKTGLAWREVR